nr:hypothetical protein [Solirubrobacterales bacterium]
AEQLAGQEGRRVLAVGHGADQSPCGESPDPSTKQVIGFDEDGLEHDQITTELLYEARRERVGWVAPIRGGE